MFHQIHDSMTIDLHPLVLRSMAKQARKIASDLDTKADIKEAEIKQKFLRSDHLKRVRLATKFFGKMIESGKNANQSLLDSSAKYSVDPSVISINWPSLKRKWRTRDQIDKDRQIITGYRNGLSDAEIGKRLDMHPKSIARRRRAILGELEGL